MTRPPRALVLEDEPLLARVLIRCLPTGWMTDHVSCGAAAREATRRQIYQVVFVDVLLGTDCGWEVLASLRGIDPELPAVIMSGNLDAAERVRGVEKACLLPKPFSREQVLALILDLPKRP